MKGVRQFVDELVTATETIRKELEGQQSDLIPLLNDELSSVYFNDLTHGLQIFEKIERHMESIEFLLQQRNYQAATEELCILEREILSAETQKILEETAMTDKIQKRIEGKRSELQMSIFDSITSFLFMKRANSMV